MDRRRPNPLRPHHREKGRSDSPRRGAGGQKRRAELERACDRLNNGLFAVAFVLATTVGMVATVKVLNLILNSDPSATEHIIGVL